jgi:hypothetical protein
MIKPIKVKGQFTRDAAVMIGKITEAYKWARLYGGGALVFGMLRARKRAA